MHILVFPLTSQCSPSFPMFPSTVAPPNSLQNYKVCEPYSSNKGSNKKAYIDNPPITHHILVTISCRSNFFQDLDLNYNCPSEQNSSFVKPIRITKLYIKSRIVKHLRGLAKSIAFNLVIYSAMP